MKRIVVALVCGLISGCSSGGGTDPADATGDAPQYEALHDVVIAPDASEAGDPAGGEDRPGDEDAGGEDVGPGDEGAGEEVTGCPGAPWCGCETDGECDIGLCVTTWTGRVCTDACSDTCPEGWVCRSVVVGSDPMYACIPRHATLCRPCRNDTECFTIGQTEGIRCVSFGAAEGSFCGGPCQADGECPDGFRCEAPDGGTRQCVPESGECACAPWAVDIGADTACSASAGEDTCPGRRVCTAAGLTACDAPAPAAETCNATDDDCNGMTDEGLGTLPCGQGECARDVPACVDGSAGACDPFEGSRPETCDGRDDDCDGDTDEGFADTDGDGVADCTDDDDDGDDVPDDGDGSGNPFDAPCAPGQVGGCDDNCPLLWNPAQADMDGDGRGDGCDPDQDGDGHASVAFGGADCDDWNAAISPAAEEGPAAGAGRCDGIDNDCDGVTDEGYGDADGDAIPDCLDPDDDNDTIPDGIDNCHLVANMDQKDTDGDGKGDACENDTDGDGLTDDIDNCVGVQNPDQTDTDGDGIGDACDSDDDGDGDPDATDCAPLDADVSHKAAESCNGLDDDCDGDVDEGFPDTDGDGLADCVDMDDDGDAILDGTDNCPLEKNADQADLDNDGQGDACDPDDDGDGVPDATDNCPRLANPDQADADGDAMGDACDPDDDGDGVVDGQDNCRLVANPGQEDWDKDGMGDACDPDVDGDGVPNEADTCPFVDDKSYDDDDDKIPPACEIDWAGDVFPNNGTKVASGQPFDVYIQFYKAGVSQAVGPCPNVVVYVRYRKVGDAAWQEGTASFVRDWSPQPWKNNEEHRFTIPGTATSGGGTLEVEFVPTDLTAGPDKPHPYNNFAITDQAGKAQPLHYPL
jgi:hypothetical protein